MKIYFNSMVVINVKKNVGTWLLILQKSVILKLDVKLIVRELFLIGTAFQMFVNLFVEMESLLEMIFAMNIKHSQDGILIAQAIKEVGIALVKIRQFVMKFVEMAFLLEERIVMIKIERDVNQVANQDITITTNVSNL